MLGRRKARDAVNVDVGKPLTVQERLRLLETDEAVLEYPSGLLQPFSRQKLGRLKRRFVQMIPAEDTRRELRVTLEAMLQMPEVRTQPFVPLVSRSILDRQTTDVGLVKDEAGGRGMVSFSCFATVLAVFSAKQPLELKRKVLFDVYDHEAKGCITVDDFLRVISSVSRSNAAKQTSLRQRLELQLAPYIRQTQAGSSGVLYADFDQLIDDEQVQTTMTIAY